MDRDLAMLGAIKEGRLATDPETGKIYSRTIRGRKGEKVELPGSNYEVYRVHTIYYKGQKWWWRAHQIMWISVNGLYDKSELMIDHINRDRADNRISNLRLVTPQGNRENRTPYTGQFSDDQKMHMFLMHHEGLMSFREIGEEYEISKSRAHQIVSEFNPLDGITLPQWRKETIMAAGNSVVPHLAYRIFQSIQYAEDML